MLCHSRPLSSLTCHIYVRRHILSSFPFLHLLSRYHKKNETTTPPFAFSAAQRKRRRVEYLLLETIQPLPLSFASLFDWNFGPLFILFHNIMSNRTDLPHRFVQAIKLSLDHNVRLLLPRSFVECSGRDLGDTVRLTGYDGIICNIQLERADDNIYLGTGWPQFFDHHNLEDGYVLVFEYNGNSTFDVSIFECSGVEVTYESDRDFTYWYSYLPSNIRS
ncbi:B3 domain-containing protein At4g01580-like [Olea europaea var. sylvestris]|uniref:B3 domain-containing protein At4g01580-like n=1 Tax=Olea europaea var. sylvestris TaxID=158386 RepID=UPI000C1CEF7B|nr:B3 domain-containing protein At4g01580-like [Olea europaea var. sylvestris]